MNCGRWPPPQVFFSFTPSILSRVILKIANTILPITNFIVDQVLPIFPKLVYLKLSEVTDKFFDAIIYIWEKF